MAIVLTALLGMSTGWASGYLISFLTGSVMAGVAISGIVSMLVTAILLDYVDPY